MVHEIIPVPLQILILKFEFSEMSPIPFHLELDETPNFPPPTSGGLLIVRHLYAAVWLDMCSRLNKEWISERLYFIGRFFGGFCIDCHS
jgi:hypothetical protein